MLFQFIVTYTLCGLSFYILFNIFPSTVDVHIIITTTTTTTTIQVFQSCKSISGFNLILSLDFHIT